MDKQIFEKHSVENYLKMLELPEDQRASALKGFWESIHSPACTEELPCDLCFEELFSMLPDEADEIEGTDREIEQQTSYVDYKIENYFKTL